MNRTTVSTLAFLGLAVLLAGLWFWWQLRPYESNVWVDVSWQSGGQPMTATVIVVDNQGTALPGMFVKVDNDSGGNGATTDQQGKATISLGENEVTGIELNNVLVIDRSGWRGIFAPSVGNGLFITIVVKDRSRFVSAAAACSTPCPRPVLR